MNKILLRTLVLSFAISSVGPLAKAETAAVLKAEGVVSEGVDSVASCNKKEKNHRDDFLGGSRIAALAILDHVALLDDTTPVATLAWAKDTFSSVRDIILGTPGRLSRHLLSSMEPTWEKPEDALFTASFFINALAGLKEKGWSENKCALTGPQYGQGPDLLQAPSTKICTDLGRGLAIQFTRGANGDETTTLRGIEFWSPDWDKGAVHRFSLPDIRQGIRIKRKKDYRPSKMALQKYDDYLRSHTLESYLTDNRSKRCESILAAEKLGEKRAERRVAGETQKAIAAAAEDCAKGGKEALILEPSRAESQGNVASHPASSASVAPDGGQ